MTRSKSYLCPPKVAFTCCLTWPRGKKQGLMEADCWVQIPAQPLTGCAARGQCLTLSGPGFLICEVGIVICSTSHGRWESYTCECIESKVRRAPRSAYAAVFNLKNSPCRSSRNLAARTHIQSCLPPNYLFNLARVAVQKTPRPGGSWNWAWLLSRR